MKKLGLVTVIIITASLAVCCSNHKSVHGGASQAVQEDPSKHLRDLTHDLIQLQITPQVFNSFYNYYRERPAELRFLPSFQEGRTPLWNSLTHFIYYFAEKTTYKGSREMFIPVASFDETVKRFFPDFEYTHGSSGYLKLSEKGYSPTGWEDEEDVFYRLKDLSKDPQGTFSATFEGYYFGEEFDWENPVGNQKAVKVKAIALGMDGQKLSAEEMYRKVVPKLFFGEDFPYESLVANETVKIKFRLSGLEEFPLKYISCSRSFSSGHFAPIAAQDLKQALKNLDQISTTPEFISLFFNYYKDSSMELRMLPDFAEGTAPPWDELTLFGYYFAENISRDENGYTVMPKPSFEEVIKRFFPKFNYIHHSSTFFNYDGEKYTALGWSDHDTEYFRLISLSRNSDGDYTASLDSFRFSEDDFFDDPEGCYSSNMIAVKKRAQQFGEDTTRLDLWSFDRALLGIFLEKDYPGSLIRHGTVDIKFRLSANQQHPLTYISCHHTYTGN